MKIRTGFVSNSSSSSYMITVKADIEYIVRIAREMMKDSGWLEMYSEDHNDTPQRCLESLDIIHKHPMGRYLRGITFPSCNYETFILRTNRHVFIFTCNNHTFNLESFIDEPMKYIEEDPPEVPRGWAETARMVIRTSLGVSDTVGSKDERREPFEDVSMETVLKAITPVFDLNGQLLYKSLPSWFDPSKDKLCKNKDNWHEFVIPVSWNEVRSLTGSASLVRQAMCTLHDLDNIRKIVGKIDGTIIIHARDFRTGFKEET